MTKQKILLVEVLALAILNISPCNATEYGLGCSFPLESEVFTCDNGLLGDRRSVYRTYLEGCDQFFGRTACDQEESRRLQDNAIKPQSMVNFTDVGFHKTRAPAEVFDMFRQHWEAHKDDNQTEWWPKKLPRNNYWAAAPHVTNFLVDGYELMEKTLPIMKTVMEDWTGVEQRATNMYGIRIYKNGTIISPHVDRYPLVISVIVNVDQDVEEPWPLEVINRNGKAVNITLEPGDMVLYEGHSTIHGRPFALKGSFYANAFISFEPTGRQINQKDGSYIGEQASQDGLPPFLIPDSPEESIWRKENPDGWLYKDPLAYATIQASTAHLAAAVGNVAGLHEIVVQGQPDRLHEADPNGWRPIHEAAFAGHRKAVEFLLQHGADVNAATTSGQTPLDLVVMQSNMKSHPIVKFLMEHGGTAK